MDAEKPARRQRTHIKIWCDPEEKAKIEALAASVGESASSYLRLVGLGYQPRSIIDREQARELVRINGDLGRLGGLLKLWLTDDEKLDEFKPMRMTRIIRGVLEKIEANQEELRAIVKTVLRARG
ncbi:MAG: conjugal transfer transcriptional regulator TraJ [Paracoccus denitrificans]|uniref:Conjugal transfer transcriptional regulator TraJ n=1 Tax=Paracoccus denitrificans TaxID=266 RepID=A0A533I481_PARDE|nr:MAG: conjugal transfer transcriptional regulator TraJ [Paracoccus denitrificans]